MSTNAAMSDHRKEHREHREHREPSGGGPAPDAVLWVHAYTTTSRQRPAPLLHRRPAEGGHHRVLRLRWHDRAGTGGLHAELPPPADVRPDPLRRAWLRGRCADRRSRAMRMFIE